MAVEGPQEKRNRFIICSSQQRRWSSSVDGVGLRILIQISSPGKSNFLVVNKPTLIQKKQPTFPTNRIHPTPNSFCESNSFLKSCFLCHKKLSLDKDVYMYRGDQGFCSVECRNRQIYLDEIKEMEESTKKTLATFRQCGRPSDRCETRALLGQLRRRQKPFSCLKDRAMVLL